MFKNTFKRLLLMALFVVSIILPASLKAEETPYFELIISSDIEYEYLGVEHREIVAKMRLGSSITNQVINYTAANPLTDPTIQIVTGDNFIDHGYGTGHLRGQAYNVNNRYLNQAQVISGVNGDFYDISNSNSLLLGRSAGPHIREYRTIYEGYSASSANLIGFFDDGRVVIGPPVFKGYQVTVLDNAGAKKDIEVEISGFNRIPEEGEVTAIFTDHDGILTSPEPKMVFKAIDAKAVNSADSTNKNYFGEGKLSYITTDDVDVKYGEFVLMGEKLFTEDLITESETVIVQNVIGGIHEGIRSGLSGRQMLIKNGEIISHEDKAVHPRTALGIKEDGTVFFVTVDGRASALNRDGVDFEQLAYLMEFFGAVEALNVDGGGSSTMLFYNESTKVYEVKNRISDSNIRSVSNGMFFVKGTLEIPLPPAPFPDNRLVLDSPTNVYIDDNNTLRFNAVTNADYYVIKIDNRHKYTVETNYLSPELPYGEHRFEIQAFGDLDIYKQSPVKNYEASIFSSGMFNLINGLKDYTKGANHKQST